MIYCLDLWGTLVHSAAAWQKYGRYDELLQASGGPSPAQTYAFTRDTLMTGVFGSYEEMVDRTLQHFGLALPRAVRDELVVRWAAENAGVDWLPGARERLGALRVSEHTLVLVTNTTSLGWEAANATLTLGWRFDRLFLSCDEKMAKPAGAVWRRLMSWFPKATPGQFVMVGDNPEDDLEVPPRLGWQVIPAQDFRDGCVARQP